MRFAVIDNENNIIRSWDTGDALRERLDKIIARSFRFLPLRPKLRKDIEQAIDTVLAEMVAEFGLDVSTKH